MPSAAIYTRISHDATDQGLGVARQLEDCRALAARLGLAVVAVYEENDVGASTRSRKPRPQYRAMLDAARQGAFDVIVAYSNSRLTRRPLELEDLIALHEQHGTVIRTVVSGEDNLSTADGRMVARIKASVDAAEAERTSERLKRHYLQNARMGRRKASPWGGGFGSTPEEAQLVREAAEDITGGTGPTAIARRWNDQGVRTRGGKEWSPEGVRQLMRMPRLAGIAVYRGRPLRDAAGGYVLLDEPGVLTVEAWEAVVAALAGPKSQRPFGRRYLLSSILRCGVCGARMSGSAAKGNSYRYHCSRWRHLTAPGPPVDAYVADAVLQAVALIDERATRPADVATRERLRALASEIQFMQEQLDDALQLFRTGQVSGSAAGRMIDAAEAELERLLQEQANLQAQARAQRPELDGERWAQLDDAQRHAVVRQWLEAVWVRPPAAPRERFNLDRLDIVWRGASPV